MLVIILAAGKGTRMKSELPKALHPVAGKPMLGYSIDAAKALGAEKIVVIVDSDSEQVRKAFANSGVIFCEQREQLGTANAVLAAEELIASHKGFVLIIPSNMPNVQPETLRAFMATTSLFCFAKTPFTKRPHGYDGAYYCEASDLLRRLHLLKSNNKHSLADILAGDDRVWDSESPNEFYYINDRAQLAFVSKIIWRKRAEKLMAQGVYIIEPDLVYLSEDTEVEPDVTIYPNTYFEGRNKIGAGCVLYSGVRVVDSQIGRDNTIKENSLIEESRIGDGCSIGPMAHLRPGTVLHGKNTIGNFVELKKTTVAKCSKAAHLTYLGDAEIGTGVNIGCGTITCNYDGYNKFKTIIGNDVFVGSDTQFIAPVTIGDNALIASGTTVTKDVPADALAIARATQVNVAGKGAEIKKKALAKKESSKRK
jgi:bifunctional UDP-N-acetylglucosamine pyrophosphorylase/glucosamine-1-phosphate N-acetyltransferase